MPQTILAILGVTLLATTMTNFTAARLHLQQRAIGREMEEMGSAVALEVMEVIRLRAYDQAVLDGTTDGSMGDLGKFTYNGPNQHFSSGRACSVFGTGSDDCNDIDDFHRMEPAVRPFAMGRETIDFQVEVEVVYVDDDMKRFNGRAFNKQVTVYVQDAWEGERNPYLSAPIELSRVFSHQF